MKISPIRPVAITLRGPKPSEFPFRSGMASVVESITWTNPGGSPLGDASSRPSASHVATTTKGERSMNSRAVSSISVRSFTLTRSPGVPIAASSSASVVTAWGSESCVGAILQAFHHFGHPSEKRSCRRRPTDASPCEFGGRGTVGAVNDVGAAVASELELLDPAWRVDPGRVAVLLADDFVEIGRSWHVWSHRKTGPPSHGGRHRDVAACGRRDVGFDRDRALLPVRAGMGPVRVLPRSLGPVDLQVGSVTWPVKRTR